MIEIAISRRNQHPLIKRQNEECRMLKQAKQIGGLSCLIVAGGACTQLKMQKPKTKMAQLVAVRDKLACRSFWRRNGRKSFECSGLQLSTGVATASNGNERQSINCRQASGACNQWGIIGLRLGLGLRSEDGKDGFAALPPARAGL